MGLGAIMNPQPKKWSAIILTCQNKASSYIFQREFELYQSKGFIDKDTLILAVEDPKSRVGSGGATLNALLVVTEHLSAKAGFLTLESSVLHDANILIMHMGQSYPFSPCGRPFTTLPAKHMDCPMAQLSDNLVNNFGCLLYTLSNYICAGSPCGVWVCSTEMMLTIPAQTTIYWSEFTDDILVLLFESSTEYARQHGVCKLGEQGEIQDIMFRESDAKIRRCALSNGKVPLVGSPVFFSHKAAEILLCLHYFPPLDACTYYGLDNGASPIQLALVFDLILCMATEITEDDFVSGERSGTYGKSTRRQDSNGEANRMVGARRMLWKHLRCLKAKGEILPNCQYSYMSPSGACYRQQLLTASKLIEDSGLPFTYNSRSHIAPFETEERAKVFSNIDDRAVVVNSLIQERVTIGSNAVVSHCHLQSGLSIGRGCIVSGVGPHNIEQQEFSLPVNLCLLGYNICLPNLSDRVVNTLVVFGVSDNLEASVESGTFCNLPWEEFFERTGLCIEDVWPRTLDEDQRCLMKARLFPVICPFSDDDRSVTDVLWLAEVQTSQNMSQEHLKYRWCSSLRLSLEDILTHIDLRREFDWKRSLWFDIGRRQVQHVLTNNENINNNPSSDDTCLLPFFKACVKERLHKELLETLDEIVCSSSASVAARAFYCIADVLGAMTGDKAGLRSGPAGNVTWRHAFQLLENHRIKEGAIAMAAERTKWIDRPDLLIRAARHYEGAEQILRKHAVMSTREFIKTGITDMPPMGRWVIAEGPARLDLCGAWSDTPPIAYESGGCVTNVAIKLNGKKPIEVKVKRIPELEIVAVILAGDHSTRVVCKELDDLSDYSQPHAPGALIKACICAVNILNLSSNQSLSTQLLERYHSGFEIHSRADVPFGSGLGTSSILAGVILGALLRAAGRTASVDSLIHAVMIVEQMLTCGGGWQDNVGGLAPGFKCARSSPTLPMRVTFDNLLIPPASLEKFNKSVVFAYTGKTRLAKNLLQGVVRNWYSRVPEVVEVAKKLVVDSERCAKALLHGDLAEVGKCVHNCREYKKVIAPGSEPDDIREMMDSIDEYAYGQCLTGAGGGGFLFIIAKSPVMAQQVKYILNCKYSDEVTIYEATVDNEGLTIRVEP